MAALRASKAACWAGGRGCPLRWPCGYVEAREGGRLRFGWVRRGEVRGIGEGGGWGGLVAVVVGGGGGGGGGGERDCGERGEWAAGERGVSMMTDGGWPQGPLQVGYVVHLAWGEASVIM